MKHPRLWMSVKPQGLYCAAGGFYIDPVIPVERAVITHGHSDHARAGHGEVFATPETLAIMAVRYGEEFCGRRTPLLYGEERAIGAAILRLAPAGHILGSAQALIVHEGGRIVVSGDYKRRRDPTCVPFEPIACDVFVTEATFGLPVFRQPSVQDELQKLLGSLALFQDRCHLVGVYALGKCQRVMLELRHLGYEKPFYIHGALARLCDLYKAHGFDLGDVLPVAGANKAALAGEIVFAPPSALADRWSRSLPNVLTSMASGWMQIRARAKQRMVELPLVISDHADWDELLATLRDVGAPEIWITHGREDALSYAAEKLGLRARCLCWALRKRAETSAMDPFARLLDRLYYTQGNIAKSALVRDYLARTPDPDRGYAIAALAGALHFDVFKRHIIRAAVEKNVDAHLFALARDYVGETSETVAHIWPHREGVARLARLPRLSEVIARFSSASKVEIEEALILLLDSATPEQRWALLKLGTGSLRVGISARFMKTILAQYGNKDVADIEALWHGLTPPYIELLAWLEGRGDKPHVEDAHAFHPLMLSHPLDDGIDAITPEDFAAEWKYDGIRVQLAAAAGSARLYSRNGDDISGAFPDLVAGIGAHVVLDGELLIKRDGIIAPFNDLQQRLNRKQPAKKLIDGYPAHLVLYDIVSHDGKDVRHASFLERRARLEHWVSANGDPRFSLSQLLAFSTLEELGELRLRADRGAANFIEGVMLKRKTSPYIAGRPKGHWYKWKRDPLAVDAVLMYAQRGSGKRSSYYSDYTFGLWQEGVLLPIGKAYSGFTDEELRRLDSWIRNHTVNQFGPVREVEKALVFEVAFDSVHRSPRHKSGFALRFPRISRIRWDKPAGEADALTALEPLLQGAALERPRAD